MAVPQSLRDRLADVPENDWGSTEFVALPIFGRNGRPECQIEIHLGRRDALTLAEQDAALRHAQRLLTTGMA